jgi:hypothetical protein
MVDRLDHALTLLAGGARDLPERQRTMQATIEWSTRLLGDDQRELLLRLGVFRGGFGLEAAEWMSAGLDGDAVEALGELVDGSPRPRAGPRVPRMVRDARHRAGVCEGPPRGGNGSTTAPTGTPSSSCGSQRRPAAS